jgi:hypothetical protein
MKKADTAPDPIPEGRMQGDVEVRSEARGSHWVAWITRPGENTPSDAVLVVGRTQEEAEGRLRERAARVLSPPAGATGGR